MPAGECNRCSGITYNHDAAPEESDHWKEDAWSDLAEKNGRRWLEEDVWDEEDEGNDGVTVNTWCWFSLGIDELEIDVHAGGGVSRCLLCQL